MGREGEDWSSEGGSLNCLKIREREGSFPLHSMQPEGAQKEGGAALFLWVQFFFPAWGQLVKTL